LGFFRKNTLQSEIVDQAPDHLENQTSDDHIPALISN
jgi:hypothetical protein